METIDLIYEELKSVRSTVERLDERMDGVEKGIAVDRVKHGIIGAIAAAIVTVMLKVPEWFKW